MMSWREKPSRYSQYSKILDQAPLPTLLGARATEPVRTAHLFGNPWPPDPRAVLNYRAPRSQGPPWLLVPEEDSGTGSPKAGTSVQHPLHAPNIPTVKVNSICPFDKLGEAWEAGNTLFLVCLEGAEGMSI